jgi:Acyltransferase family/Ankyrin repeats (3 copies)
MSQPASSHQRLHDLDALRATAMLIGIVYHAALSFAIGFPWMIQDVAQAKWPFIFQAWVHGFRMQLFMLVSGFFTAMLWRQKGLKALLWHRCRRVLFPCLLGLVTVVPAMNWAVGFAFTQASANSTARSTTKPPAVTDLWTALQAGDVKAAESFLTAEGSLSNLHPAFAVTPLQWAALNGRRDAVALLLDRGAPVDSRNRDGHTALHGAAFMGYDEIVRLLLARGADVNGRSNDGETPLRSASQDFDVVQYIAGLLSLPVDKARWEEGRKSVREQLTAAGGLLAVPPAAGEKQPSALPGIWNFLVNQPVFILIWFLWFLVWLVGIFSVYALLAQRFGWRVPPHGLVLSPANLLWLVPLTMVPTAMMDFNLGIGPDTVMGIIPAPHVLLYYVLFFFFGVIYYDCDDRQGRLGGLWRWMLPLTLLVVFPLALEFATGTFGFRDSLLPKAWHRPASVFFQSVFAWTMSFSSIGLFRALLTRENHTIRYLSDSAYWLYLAHLPLCIAGQAIISQWAAPAWIKLPLFSIVLTAFLLLTYHYLVRYTWIGTLLNGKRKRPASAGSVNPGAQAQPG